MFQRDSYGGVARRAITAAGLILPLMSGLPPSIGTVVRGFIISRDPDGSHVRGADHHRARYGHAARTRKLRPGHLGACTRKKPDASPMRARRRYFKPWQTDQSGSVISEGSPVPRVPRSSPACQRIQASHRSTETGRVNHLSLRIGRAPICGCSTPSISIDFGVGHAEVTQRQGQREVVHGDQIRRRGSAS